MTDRIKSLLEQLHLTPSEFAERIGVQRSSVSHVLSGRNKPSIDFLEKILIVFPEVDATWLITGKPAVHKFDKTDEEKNIIQRIQVPDLPFIQDENKKTPAPSVGEPVDYIILVYKNNTFRILNPFK
jgi:transcriptional regulator with XRE-family HTH domain